MTGVGDFLKNHREQKGIRLEEIASITKIHIHHLQLIERESWKDLPPEPFIRGFLTAYAKYVGADPREALTKFYEGKGITPVEPEAVPPLTPVTSPNHTSSSAVNPSRLIEQAEPFPVAKVLMAGGAVAFVLLVGTLITIGKKASTPDPVADNTTTSSAPAAVDPAVPPVAPGEEKPFAAAHEPVAANLAPVPVAPVVNPPAAAEKATVAKAEAVVEKPKAEAKKTETVAKTEPAADFKHVITVETVKKTWIKVVADGAAPKQTISKDNDKLTFSAKEKIKVVLGNPTGVKVSHNGTLAEGTKSGSVHYYRFPTNAKFPQDQPKPRAVSSDGDTAAPKEGTSNAPKTIGDWLDSPNPESRTQ